MAYFFLAISGIFVFFLTLFAFIRRYKRCPSDKILVVFGKIGGSDKGLSAKCYHGGAAFVWPVIQDYRFLELRPMPIDIKLEGVLLLAIPFTYFDNLAHNFGYDVLARIIECERGRTERKSF